MSETTEKWSEKLNGQYQMLNKNLDKVAKASKGLLSILKESGTKQFNELVATGEKTDDTLFEQVKESMKQPFTDFRGSVNKAKFASFGLIAKVKDNGTKYFEDLVAEGEKSESPKSAKTSETKTQSKTKSGNKAA